MSGLPHPCGTEEPDSSMGKTFLSTFAHRQIVAPEGLCHCTRVMTVTSEALMPKQGNLTPFNNPGIKKPPTGEAPMPGTTISQNNAR